MSNGSITVRSPDTIVSKGHCFHAALYLHVVGQNPQPRKEILKKNVDGDELQVRAQQRLVVARIGSRDKQPMPSEYERIVLADVVRRLVAPTETKKERGG